MIRNLKTLGLVLAAALTLSAVVASAASANPKLTPVPEEYPVTVKATQTVVNVLELEGTRPTECATATSEGTTANKAEAEESQLTDKLVLAECTTTILGNKDTSTVTMNNCTLKTTTTETTSGTIAAEGWEVTGKELHIFCPAGQFIEIHVYTSSPNHVANIAACTYLIGPQTAGGSIVRKFAEKNAEGAGTSGNTKFTLSGIAVTRSSGTVTNCGAASQSATFKGEQKFELFNSKGEMLRGKFED